MKKLIFATTAMLLAATATPSLALDIDTRGEIENLRSRLDRLESNAAKKDQLSLFSLNKKITFYGALEAELSYNSPENRPDESDITLATAMFGFQADVNDHVHGHLTFLYEEDETPLGVDEGFVSVDLKDMGPGHAKLVAGQFYLPFGGFDSEMLTDPVTLDLGETDRSALMGQYELGPVEASLAVFNGDSDPDGKNNVIDGVAASLTVNPVKPLELGVSYISDLAETDIELIKGTTYARSVDGISAFATLDLGPVTLSGEYLTALKTFTAGEVAAAAGASGELSGEKPQAFFLEARGELTENLSYAVRYENSDDFEDDLRRYGATCSWSFAKNTALSLEYLFSDAGDNPDTNTSHTVTAQLAVEF